MAYRIGGDSHIARALVARSEREIESKLKSDTQGRNARVEVGQGEVVKSPIE